MALVVGDQYRTNELSLRPGGYTVVVEECNGRVFEYVRVKKPHAYIQKLMGNSRVQNAYVKPDKK